MRISRSISYTLLIGALFAVPAMAQEAPTSSESAFLSTDALDIAVATHESDSERQRTQLSELLSHSAVRDLAHARGFDMTRVESAVQGLTDAELAVVAPVAAETAATLQSGGTITISAVALIIILLVLILVT
jgi:hypothetical protein